MKQIKRIKIVCLLILMFISFSSFSDTPADECEKLFERAHSEVEKKNYKKALELFTEAHILASEHQFHEKTFYAKNNIGIIYYSLNDYGEALNHYLEAYTFAIKHLGPVQEMAILNNIAILYSEDNQYDKAGDYFEIALGIAKKEKDSIKAGLYTTNLGLLANKAKSFETSRHYFSLALDYVKEKEAAIYLTLYAGLSEMYLHTGEYRKSIEALELVFPLAKETPEFYVMILLRFSDYYFHQGDIDKAAYYCYETMKHNPVLTDRAFLYDQLSKIAFEKKEYEKAMQYKDSAIYMKDSLNQLKNNRLYENNKVKFELQNYVHQLDRKQYQLGLERVIFISAAVVLLVLIFLIYRLFKNKAVKEAQRKAIAIREQEIMALELEKEKQEHLLLVKQLREVETEALLRQEQLKNEIEQKNRELSAKALYLSGRNEIIEQIIHSLTDHPDLINNNSLKETVRKLKENINTDQEWESFIGHFEEVNPGFLTVLKKKHPNLNANDIRFICYVYMNLSTKEICSVFNITQEACRKRKERISRKMELDEGGQLYEYLIGFS